MYIISWHTLPFPTFTLIRGIEVKQRVNYELYTNCNSGLFRLNLLQCTTILKRPWIYTGVHSIYYHFWSRKGLYIMFSTQNAPLLTKYVCFIFIDFHNIGSIPVYNNLKYRSHLTITIFSSKNYKLKTMENIKVLLTMHGK